MNTNNKCDNCQNLFNCVSESGNCDESKEHYVPLENDDLDFTYLRLVDVDGTAP